MGKFDYIDMFPTLYSKNTRFDNDNIVKCVTTTFTSCVDINSMKNHEHSCQYSNLRLLKSLLDL